MLDEQSRQFTVRIYALLFGIGTLTLLGLVLMLNVLTNQIDEQAARATGEKLNLLLEERQDNMSNIVHDFAHWQMAYDAVRARDGDAVYDHLGSSAIENDLFDWMVILSHDEALIYNFGFANALALGLKFTDETFADVLTMLRQSPPQQLNTFSSFVWTKDELSLVSAAWMTPEDETIKDVTQAPVLIAGRKLGPDALSAIQEMSGANMIDLHRTRPASNHILALRGPLGEQGYLTWEPPRPGLALRDEARSWIIVFGLAVSVLVALIGYRFSRLTQQLARALRLASTDSLTGLCNRVGLLNCLEKNAFQSALNNGQLAVLSIDLNGFKEINDTYGHEAGDHALKVCAQRLRKTAEAAHCVVRTGGDEFLCVVADQNAENTAFDIAETFETTCAQPIAFNAVRLRVYPSIGIACAAPGDTWETVLRNSDLDMYAAKQRQRRHQNPVREEPEIALLA